MAEHRDAVRVFVLDGEVVEDVAVALAAAGLPAAEAGDGFHRVRADDPIHDVEIVDVLLDDVVAGEPGEVVPVSELPLHVAPAGLAIDDPDLAAVPVALGVDDVADGAVVQAADGFAIVGRMAALRAGGDAELFLGGELAGFHDGLHAGHIDGGRLLHEYVLAGFDGGLEVRAAESAAAWPGSRS